jgi:hypothetical protein
MSKDKQLKTFEPPAIDGGAFEAALGAIQECRAKPSYDYQRIIICFSRKPDLGLKLARRSGAALIGPGPPLSSKRRSAGVVVSRAWDSSLEMLESIVFFVNRTRGVVVLVVTRRALAGWHDRWPIAAAQIRRRTHIAIDFDK